jgi:hypothetical protein
MTHKEEFIDNLGAIIDYCHSAKLKDCTEEEYRKLNGAAKHARSILYIIVNQPQEVLDGDW